MSRQPRIEFPTPVFITESDQLAALCARLAEEPFVTIDTEFIRERTYWPELCVVQLGGVNDVAVIDAQAEGMDMAPLGALLANDRVTKVFHAARQDVEIFLLMFGATPVPIFDTQIAAMVAGFGDQVGYDALVSALTGTQIDKSHRFSDWSARPLSASQLAYAAADVTHLRIVYQKLLSRLEREDRGDWVQEEMAALTEPSLYRTDPETMWQRLKLRPSNRRQAGLLRAIAAWREREAQRVNIPRGRLLKDEAIPEIAALAPEDAEALTRARGITRGFAEGKSGVSLLAAIAAAKSLPDDALPEIAPRGDRDGPRPSPALVALLRVLLAAKSEEHGVAPRLLASSDDLDRLATEAEPAVPATQGWRRRMFGEDAMALRDGRVALATRGKRIRLIHLDAEAPAPEAEAEA
ncbi:ribonuclease D [Acidisoma silvae]|uniref:Ribonuclease D n=1 Tax=Acidisoma silvae TaxID=2802396 RepID=A0A963YUD7_9PROT|nr:ribonuclease D [Acidisoma silvae]MCB8876747.1 ribonuclease D [Acidisoma silvae]